MANYAVVTKLWQVVLFNKIFQQNVYSLVYCRFGVVDYCLIRGAQGSLARPGKCLGLGRMFGPFLGSACVLFFPNLRLVLDKSNDF